MKFQKEEYIRVKSQFIFKSLGTIVHITYQKRRKYEFKDKPITRVLIGFHDHIQAYSCYILKHENGHIQVHESIWFLVCNQIYRWKIKYSY